MKKRGVLLGMLAATAIVGSVGEAAATVTVTLRKTGVRRPRPLRHEVDSALHHQNVTACQHWQGLQARDTAFLAHGSPPLGDLTSALDFASRETLLGFYSTDSTHS